MLPHQSEANRRTRWLWGAFEQLRAIVAARLPEDDCQQVDTSALPVKHPSRVRGPDGWTGPGNDLAARFGRDAAHTEWFYGFRLAVKTDLGSRIVRAWSIVPAAVSERDVAGDLRRPALHSRRASRHRRWPGPYRSVFGYHEACHVFVMSTSALCLRRRGLPVRGDSPVRRLSLRDGPRRHGTVNSS